MKRKKPSLVARPPAKKQFEHAAHVEPERDVPDPGLGFDLSFASWIVSWIEPIVDRVHPGRAQESIQRLRAIENFLAASAAEFA